MSLKYMVRPQKPGGGTIMLVLFLQFIGSLPSYFRKKTIDVQTIDDFAWHLMNHSCDRFQVVARAEFMDSRHSICSRRLFIDFRANLSDGKVLTLRVPGPFDLDPRCEMYDRLKLAQQQTFVRLHELANEVVNLARVHRGQVVTAEIFTGDVPNFSSAIPQEAS